MYELGFVSKKAIIYRSRQDFDNWLVAKIGSFLNNKFSGKSIIYNTNYSWFKNFQTRWTLRWRHGFKQIGSYRGYNNNRVYILLKTK